ncbi:hypothetical protein D3C72_2312890 [compost metagenome]
MQQRIGQRLGVLNPGMAEDGAVNHTHLGFAVWQKLALGLSIECAQGDIGEISAQRLCPPLTVGCGHQHL